ARLAAPPPAPVAGAVRAVVPPLPRVLPAQPGQPPLRPAPEALLRPEPSRRGLRRDLRRLAPSPLRLAEAVRGVAGVAEARVRGRADGRAARPHRAGPPPADGGAALLGADDAGRALPAQARVVRAGLPDQLRPRAAAALLRQPAAPPARGGLGVPPAVPPRDPPPGGALDRGIPAYPGPGADRHDRPLPRTQAPGGRGGADGAGGLHGAPHGEDDALALQRTEVAGPMKRLRILALMHPTLVPPDALEGRAPAEVNSWKTEYDIVSTLRGLGHDVRPLGVYDELAPIRAAIEDWKPHVVFNLLEEFQGQVVFDHHLVSYLELLGVP